MKKLYAVPLLFSALLFFNQLTAQISLSSSPYTQNFDSLSGSGNANAWTDNSTLAGWYSTRTVYIASEGTSTSGALYSFGVAGTTERALGSIASGSTNTLYYGARFVNNSGAAITNLQISYKGEQWRNGGNTNAQSLKFYYQTGTNLTSLTTGTWTPLSTLDFVSPTTGASASSLVGNDAANSAQLSAMLTGITLLPGAELFIRWEDINDSGNDHGLGIDDFSLSFTSNSGDVTPPAISTLSPANNSTDVAPGSTATITFNEAIQKGSGSIYVKKASDNSVVQTLNVTSSDVSVSGNSASFNFSHLAVNTMYYITVDNGGFKDLSGNAFSGVTNASTWTFTTNNKQYYFEFSNCSSSLSDGFTQQSVTGAETWGCTSFGYSGNGVQINGYNGGSKTNNDWLVSPALDLTGTMYPILSFYSVSAFTGAPLRLFITTNYTGDVTTTTWTELNGFFPAVASGNWTLSDNIDLSAYKAANVRIAFQYTSTTSAASRWTLDNIAITNSATPPQPVVNFSTRLVDFREMDLNVLSASKMFSFSIYNLTSNLTITAPANYDLSKDGNTFTNSITFTPAEAQNTNSVYIRIKPSRTNATFAGYLQFSSTGYNQQPILVKGNTYLESTTLKVVNWNLEWFGGPQAPTNDSLQQANVKKVLDYLNADIIAVEEVVDTARFGNLVRSLNNSYKYVVSDFATSAVNPADANYATNYASGQKLGLIYKSSVGSNVTARGLLKSTNTAAYTNWSSGRFPFLVNLDVTKSGYTTNMNFIVLHAKAQGQGTEQSDYNRRRGGVQELKDTLDAYFSTKKVIILGDFNDDLDQSIYVPSTGPIVSSYTDLISDSTDADSYRSVTLPLSLAGQNSTATYGDMIDHVVISNEVASMYAPLTATVYSDIASFTGIADYANTTTDHYPVMTRYFVSGIAPAPLPVKLMEFGAGKQGELVKIFWKTAQELNTKEFVVERSADGVTFSAIGKVAAAGNASNVRSYQLTDNHPLHGANYYRLVSVDWDNKSETSRTVRLDFESKGRLTVWPNPARDAITVTTDGSRSQLQLLDLSGRVVKTQVLTNAVETLSIQGLSKGVYLLRVITASQQIFTDKLVVE